MYYNADLKKVIMLPGFETIKRASFANRLVAYNKSFVWFNWFAVIGYPALFVREQNQIISMFRNLFKAHGNIITVTFWLDNCTSQNKNWTLFSLSYTKGRFYLPELGSFKLECNFP